jgi:hypothetical protein
MFETCSDGTPISHMLERLVSSWRSETPRRDAGLNARIPTRSTRDESRRRRGPGLSRRDRPRRGRQTGRTSPAIARHGPQHLGDWGTRSGAASPAGSPAFRLTSQLTADAHYGSGATASRTLQAASTSECAHLAKTRDRATRTRAPAFELPWFSLCSAEGTLRLGPRSKPQ